MKCKICGKEISDSIYHLHLKRHEILNQTKKQEFNLETKTKSEIMNELDNLNIDYSKRMTKEQLIDLLGGD